MSGVRIDLRVNGKPIRMQNTSDILNLRSFLDNLLTLMSQAPEAASESPISTHRVKGETTTDSLFGQEISSETKKRGPNPVTGERVIDYIVRALQMKESLPRSIREDPTVDDVYRTVLDLGWKGSDEPDKAKRVLMVTARKHKDLVNVSQGKLLLTGKGQKHLKDDDDIL